MLSNNKAINALFPVILDKESSIKAARYGCIAAAFISVTTLISVISQVMSSEIIGSVEVASKIIGNILPITVLGFLIYRMSIIASVLALLVCLVEIIWKFNAHGTVGILPLFFLFFVNSVRGTIAYRKFLNAKDNK
jgi:hypothetical protein